MEHKFVRIGMKLWTYKRYVDDINNIRTPPKLGVGFDSDKLIEDERSVEEDRVLDADERTMRLFQSVANSIHPSIEVEIDCQSRHHDGKLPILDLKVWIEKRNRDGESQGENRVLHKYYSKEISSAYVINARSALSWRSKKTILTQEVLRVLLNCSVELPWQVLVKHVYHMMMRLQYSGYDQKFRTEVVKSALNVYKHILRLDACGEKPMHRTRTWRKIERVREKRKKREGWYRKGGYDSVIFVPATPGSELKRRYEKEVDEAGMKIRVTEQSGIPLKRHLQRSNPFKSEKCEREDCLVCTSGGKGTCYATGVTYEIVCKECSCKYVGETARSAYSRGLEHLKTSKTEQEQAVMWKHAQEKHGGKIPTYVMNMTGIFGDNQSCEYSLQL